MKENNNHPERCILVLYPHTRGLSYVICNGAQDIIDYGLKSLKGKMIWNYGKAATNLFELAKPEVVIIKSKDQQHNMSQRQQNIVNRIIDLAYKHELMVYDYSRSQIKTAFTQFGCSTKYEIAERILKWYPFLERKMPYKRKAWLSEHHNMCYFDAFALMLTHYYLQ